MKVKFKTSVVLGTPRHESYGMNEIAEIDDELAKDLIKGDIVEEIIEEAVATIQAKRGKKAVEDAEEVKVK